MQIEDALPLSGLPRSGNPEGREEFWSPGTDNFQDYQKRGGHPLYGERDIIYRYNSLGYRCPEFDVEAQIRIVSIGCSHTLGVGLPQEAIFHERFAERLRQELSKTVVNWNLGLSGRTNDYVAEMLHLSVPVLQPDIVLILFPQFGRREYMTAHGRLLHYVPNYQHPDPVAMEVFGHFSALSSSLDDQLHFFRNYKSVECLLADRCWLFAVTKTEELESLRGHIDESRYVGGMRWLDKARDQAHAGPETHQLLSENFWNRFVALGGLERFA